MFRRKIQLIEFNYKLLYDFLCFNKKKLLKWQLRVNSLPYIHHITAILAKCFERAVLPKISSSTKPLMDILQFAYQSKRSTDDAIITLIHDLAQHLDGYSKSARCLFIDYSSVFNTMQPHVLMERLAGYNVPARLQLLVLDFLTNRQQYVRTQSELSFIIMINTGAP